MNRQLVIHPILFAAYPPIFYYATNLYYFDFSVVLMPLAVILAAAGVFWFALAKLMKNGKKAAVFVSLTLLVAFSHGAVFEFATRKGLRAAQEGLSPAEILIFGSLGTVLVAAVYFLKSRADLSQWTYLLNVISTVLLVFPLVGIAKDGFTTAAVFPDRPDAPALAAEQHGSSATPDIYFILLDGYARADVLREIYGYDNSGFLNSLRESGFVVAEASRANYPKTVMSLASTLNLTYLDDLVGTTELELVDFGPLRAKLRDNRLNRFLRGIGYNVVSFSTPYYNADLGAADVYLDGRGAWSDYEFGLVSMTPVPWLLRGFGRPVLYDLHRARVLYTLDQLPEVAGLPGPKFVYAHILSPHPPFVFDSQGTPVNPSRRYDISDAFAFLSLPGASEREYIEGYRSQLEFLNQKVTEAIRGILARSAEPPIIVLQSDHGPGVRLRTADPKDAALKERFGILNAQLLPGGAGRYVYQSVSSVNTFRLILKHYFGVDIEPLPDVSYVVEDQRPYHYMRVEAALDLAPRHEPAAADVVGRAPALSHQGALAASAPKPAQRPSGPPMQFAATASKP